MKAWPGDALEHQSRSLRWYLGHHEEAPPEIRLNTGGKSLERPELHINVLTERTRQDGQFHFYWVVTCAITWYGSESGNPIDLNSESLTALHWLNSALSRGDELRGPLVPILDFSTLDKLPTGDYINVDPNTLFTRSRDQYGLWMVSGDVRYEVEQTPVEPESPIIDSVEWKFNAV